MLLLAAVQTFCARFTNAFLTSLNPLTYESGDWLADKEAEEEVWGPDESVALGKYLDDQLRKSMARPLDTAVLYGPQDSGVVCSPYAATPDPSLTPTVGGEGPDGVVRHSPASTVGVPTLPMFNAKDLQLIAVDYLIDHFPWPDDGLFACTCGTKGFTVLDWAKHISELQISELVFYLTGLLYDQSQQK